MTADANTKKLIQDHYKIDVDAIRNLSKLANDLTKNGKLRVPGGLEIDGNLNIKGESKFYKPTYFRNQKKPDIWSHMNWKDGQVYLRGVVNIDGPGGTGKDLNVAGTSTFSGPTNFKNQKTGHSSHLNQPDGNIYLRGNVIMDGYGNSGKDLNVHGTSHLRKDLNVHGISRLAIKDGQAKVQIDETGKDGRIITYGANKKINVLIDRANQGGRVSVYNDKTDKSVAGLQSNITTGGGQVFSNYKDGTERVKLNGQQFISEVYFSPHHLALLQAHKKRLAMRADHQAYFNDAHNRVRYLHHNCDINAPGKFHTRETSCNP